jgi:hypothetical protein
MPPSPTSRNRSPYKRILVFLAKEDKWRKAYERLSIPFNGTELVMVYIEVCYHVNHNIYSGVDQL